MLTVPCGSVLADIRSTVSSSEIIAATLSSSLSWPPEIAPTPTCGQRQSRLDDGRAVSSMMSTTCVGAVWHLGCPLHCRSYGKVDEWRVAMRLVFNFARNWSRCYHVLHDRNGFGLFDSVRYGL
jgi:hypothetical protein